MSKKVILLMSLVGVCCGVVVDYQEKETKDGGQNSGNSDWHLVHMLPSSKQHMWYKYGIYAYPKYEFEYAVSDPHTGDHKRHQESRDGDHVQGEYSLIEPDGSHRRVQYSADDHTGFHAIVSKAMHKHGENAYSFIGHTRHFLPVGHGVKSKHVHPVAHHHNVYEKSLDATFKPVAVKVPKILKVLKIKDMKNVPVVVVSEKPNEDMEAKNEMTPKSMPVEAMNMDNLVVEPTPETAKTVPMTMQELMALIISQNTEMKPQMIEAQEKNNIEPITTLPIQEMPPAETTVAIPEEKILEKADSVPDSSVASSYYRPHYYYV